MIPLVGRVNWTALSVLVMAYQLIAQRAPVPKISDLSRRPPWSFLVLAWWGGLGLHFLDAYLADAFSPTRKW